MIDAASTHPTGTAGIYVDREGRNSIVIGAGANAAMTPAHVRAQGDVFADARVVLAQLESPVDAVLAGFDLARDEGVPTLLNPAPADADLPAGLLAQCDVLTPNESEFSAQLARHCGEPVEPGAVAGMADAELHRLCRRLLPHGTVVVTLGARGCLVSHADGMLRGDDAAFYRVPAVPADAIDTTGAGDAFNGALAAAWATHPAAPFHVHVGFASLYAARACESAGAATAMPHLADL